MVYINSDGTVGTRPVHKQIVAFFFGVLNFFGAFFQTLVSPSYNGRGSQYVSNFRGSSGGNPPPPPQRRFGGFAPSVPFMPGGCAGGACGR